MPRSTMSCAWYCRAVSCRWLIRLCSTSDHYHDFLQHQYLSQLHEYRMSHWLDDLGMTVTATSDLILSFPTTLDYTTLPIITSSHHCITHFVWSNHSLFSTLHYTSLLTTTPPNRNTLTFDRLHQRSAVQPPQGVVPLVGLRGSGRRSVRHVSREAGHAKRTFPSPKLLGLKSVVFVVNCVKMNTAR